MTYKNYYPNEIWASGKKFTRSNGGLHDTPEAAAAEKNRLKETHYVRSFWTGGETLSNGITRKSYFLMVRPKE